MAFIKNKCSVVDSGPTIRYYYFIIIAHKKIEVTSVKQTGVPGVTIKYHLHIF